METISYNMATDTLKTLLSTLEDMGGKVEKDFRAGTARVLNGDKEIFVALQLGKNRWLVRAEKGLITVQPPERIQYI